MRTQGQERVTIWRNFPDRENKEAKALGRIELEPAVCVKLSQWGGEQWEMR